MLVLNQHDFVLNTPYFFNTSAVADSSADSEGISGSCGPGCPSRTRGPPFRTSEKRDRYFETKMEGFVFLLMIVFYKEDF